VLTDETMPDLTGTELAREIRQLRPEISIILMSGYGGAQLSERAQAAGVIDVLRKPHIRREIAEPVARALQARCNCRFQKIMSTFQQSLSHRSTTFRPCEHIAKSMK